MSDTAFVSEVYNDLNMIYRGIGAIMAALAKRYALGRKTETPRTPFGETTPTVPIDG